MHLNLRAFELYGRGAGVTTSQVSRSQRLSNKILAIKAVSFVVKRRNQHNLLMEDKNLT